MRVIEASQGGGGSGGHGGLRAVAAALPPGSPILLLDAPRDAADRRLARLLLREAAAFGGGEAVPLPGGEVLIGGTPAAAERAAGELRALLGLAPRRLALPEALPLLDSWLPQAGRALPAAAPVGWAALEAEGAARPPGELAALSLFSAAAGGPPVAQRLAPRAPLPPEPEQRAWARERLCRRLLQALTSPAGLSALPPLRPGLRLLLDLPAAGLAGGGAMARLPGPPPIALLPLALLAEPDAFAARRAGLEAAGWEVALLADSPAALEWPLPPGCWLAAPMPAAPPPALPERLIALGAPPPWPLPAAALREAAP
ncbi:hypothetical protein [Rubritepida flocculans]|uniref:hypothetical protein n=1 Tax=Rubritepida flocculans TaxID=182403 RepID=UPI00040C91C8|nr:hypothetical protein [Rubritepida flocculans]